MSYFGRSRRYTRFPLRRVRQHPLVKKFQKYPALWKAGAALVIFMLVFSLNALDMAWSNSLVNVVFHFVTKDAEPRYSWETWGDLSRLGEGIRSVFSNSLETQDKGLLMPVQGKVITGYGEQINPDTGAREFHPGIDIQTIAGIPVKAAAHGTVFAVYDDEQYGKTVIIDHGSGLKTLYAHCSTILVRPKQAVRRGDSIAAVGSTGAARVPHLHFEVSENNQTVDPQTYLKN